MAYFSCSLMVGFFGLGFGLGQPGLGLGVPGLGLGQPGLGGFCETA